MSGSISFLDYISDPFTRSALLEQAIAHIRLTLIPIAVASVIGVLAGVIAHRSRLLKPVILNTFSTFLTIPSFGLFAILIGFVGIGNTPAMIALTMYALLAITRNTVSGLESVDSAITESAKGMGLSSVQRLLKIELPIAWPVIIAGLRVSTQIVIGVAAVAVLVGGDGLGEEIYQQGIRRIGSPGAINAVLGGTLTILLLAIAFDLAFQLLSRLTTSKGISNS